MNIVLKWYRLEEVVCTYLIENISIAVGFHIMDTKYAIIQWNIEEGSFSEIAAIGFFS